MLFFNSVKTVLYLKPQSLEIHTKTGLLATVNFTPQEVKYQELLSGENLAGKIVTVIKTEKVKKTNAVLVLAEDLVYTKRLPLLEPEEEERKLNEFLDTVPLSRENITFMVLRNSKGLLFLATNKMYYETVLATFQHLKWSIKAVIPVSVFSSFDVEAILRSSKAWKQIGF